MHFIFLSSVTHAGGEGEGGGNIRVQAVIDVVVEDMVRQ